MNAARTSFLRVCLAVVVAVLPAMATAGQPDLLQFEHENLRTGTVESLEELRGKAALLLFFEPNCSWCLKQSRTLDSMLETCPHRLDAAALGVHGNRHELKSELRRLHPDYDVYMTGRIMLNELNGVPATPVMLLADRNGRFIGHFTGYIPEDELIRILEVEHGIRCEAQDHVALQQ